MGVKNKRKVNVLCSLLIAVAFAFSAAIFVYAESSNPYYGVELSCDDPYHNVSAGRSTLFVVQIKNIGTLDDIYEITADSIEDIVCKVNGVNADEFDPYIISLGAGISTTFDVTAEVGKSVSRGKWPIIISAYSQNDPNVHDDLELIVNVTGESFNVKIIHPSNALYISSRKILPLAFPLIIGEIIIQADSSYEESNINRVEFYIDGEIRNTDYEAPYVWLWDDSIIGGHTLGVVAYENVGDIAKDEQAVWIFNP